MAKRLKHTCPRHGIKYGALEQCSSCTAGDAGPAPGEEPQESAPPPDGCMSSAQREAWYTALAEKCLANADELESAGGGDDPDGAWHKEVAIKSHRETAIKAMRAAGELGVERESDWLVAKRKREQATAP